MYCLDLSTPARRLSQECLRLSRRALLEPGCKRSELFDIAQNTSLYVRGFCHGTDLEKDDLKRLAWKEQMMKACDKSIKKTLGLVKDMLELADEGDAIREDTGCGVLYSVVRDSAYKIRQLAEAERSAHIKKGWWAE
jgi:hypothetical protein